MNFINFAQINGVVIDYSKLHPSDRIKRTGTISSPRSGNGAYFWDGQRGWVMDWSGEARVIWFSDPDAKPWTDEEKRAWVQKRTEKETAQDLRYKQAAHHAELTLQNAQLLPHGYLSYKGFEDELGFVVNDKLLIPMRNVVTNVLQGFQQIYWVPEEKSYVKKMLFGMRSKNAVFRMGARESEETWLVEGYATGLSVRNALKSCGIRASVVVCFSASNLVQIADQIGGKRYVFADNDESATGEKCAKSTGLPYTMPNEVGLDANDLHMKDGLFAIVGKIMELRKKDSLTHEVVMM
jgi:putative DNA primase/helicase